VTVDRVPLDGSTPALAAIGERGDVAGCARGRARAGRRLAGLRAADARGGTTGRLKINSVGFILATIITIVLTLVVFSGAARGCSACRSA